MLFQLNIEMETHKIKGPCDLERLGMTKCDYSQELFYGPLHDRMRRSGAYINPLTNKIEVVRIITKDGGNELYNQKFCQTISTSEVVWNLPDWQNKPGHDMNIQVGDNVQIYVSVGFTHNFYAGKFKINAIMRGRPTKIIFRNIDREDAGMQELG